MDAFYGTVTWCGCVVRVCFCCAAWCRVFTVNLSEDCTVTCVSVTVTLRDPDNALALIEGSLFRAAYLGSTQLTSSSSRTATNAVRMMQAQEAVGRIKASHISTCLCVCVCLCVCIISFAVCIVACFLTVEC